MKNQIKHLPIALVWLTLSTLNSQFSTALAQGTAFTYQGQLQNNGSPASGNYDLQFSLFGTNSGGVPIAGPVTNSAVAVINGLFTTTVDFGPGVFTGTNDWLDIAVSTNGNAFTELTPRQPLTPAPYAIFAEGANAAGISGTVPAGGLSGAYGNAVTFNNTENSFDGGFSGNGGGLTNVNAATMGGLTTANFWQTTGNTGTSPTNGNFLGTLDVQPVELRVGGLRALRLEPDPRGDGAANLIGGYISNAVQQSGSGGDFIGGGGYYYGPNIISSNSSGNFIGAGSANQIGPNINNDFIGAGGLNSIQSPESAIVGGISGTIYTNAPNSTIGGGNGNVIGQDNYGGGGSYSMIGGGNGNTIDEYDSFIGGGQGNFIQGLADHSVISGGESNQIVGSYSLPVYGVIAGGENNTIQTNDSYGVIVGGYNNTIQTNVGYSFIGGGQSNNIQGGANGAFIGGGLYNTNSGEYDTIGGGYDNIASSTNGSATVAGGSYNTASGSYATVVGGAQNTASGAYSTVLGVNNAASGDRSLAAGDGAQAMHYGSFVWADASGGFFPSTAPNQFAVRASGGVQFVTGSGMSLTIDDDAGFVPGITVSSGQYSGHMRFRNALEIWPDTGGTNGGYLDIRNLFGTQTIWMSGTNGNITCTSLNQTSDRNAKQDFAPVSSTQMLDKVARLPISEWSYKIDSGTRHIGPVAQDFYSIFNIGMDDKHIAPIDEGGVALAAIQGLNQKLEASSQKSEAQVEALKSENTELKAQVTDLQTQLDSLKKAIALLAGKSAGGFAMNTQPQLAK